MKTDIEYKTVRAHHGGGIIYYDALRVKLGKYGWKELAMVDGDSAADRAIFKPYGFIRKSHTRWFLLRSRPTNSYGYYEGGRDDLRLVMVSQEETPDHYLDSHIGRGIAFIELSFELILEPGNSGFEWEIKNLQLEKFHLKRQGW